MRLKLSHTFMLVIKLGNIELTKPIEQPKLGIKPN
jgi:hypothetical protein